MTPVPLLIAAAVQAAAAGLPAPAPTAAATAEPGASQATAIKVRNVAAEYAWLRAHRLQPAEQSLIVLRKRPFDLFKATDEAGATRSVWFDISSFYGREF